MDSNRLCFAPKYHRFQNFQPEGGSCVHVQRKPDDLRTQPVKPETQPGALEAGMASDDDPATYKYPL